ncbi:MAG: ferrous iron transport protein A [Ruminococcus sp.]|nr:ferrous iron transport protein A [Ruminococcus sp.]
MNQSTLKELEKGNEATIAGIDCKCKNKLRLLDMGFTKGTIVKPLWQARNMHITAYRIKGTLIGIRSEEARYINIIL